MPTARMGERVHLTRCHNEHHHLVATRSPRPCCDVLETITLGPDGEMPGWKVNWWEII